MTQEEKRDKEEKEIQEKVRELKAKNPLSPHIASQYDIVGLIPGKIGWKGNEYDLRKIDKKTAEKLVSEGFPNLVKKNTSSASAAATADSGKK